MERYPEPHFMCPEQLKNKSSDTELTHSTAVRSLVNADTLVLLLILLFSLTLSLFPTSLLPAPDWSPCPRGPTVVCFAFTASWWSPILTSPVLPPAQMNSLWPLVSFLHMWTLVPWPHSKGSESQLSEPQQATTVSCTHK